MLEKTRNISLEFHNFSYLLQGFIRQWDFFFFIHYTYTWYLIFRKDWILFTICMIIVFVSLPLIWLKKFISNKIDKRIPRSNIILPMSIENTVHQTFRTKSYHSTSGIIAIQQIQTSDEYFKDSTISPEGTIPALKFSFNNRKHNRNLISLSGVLILLVLFLVIFFFLIASRLGWISILNVQMFLFFSECFVPIILPTMYFTYKPQNLILVLKEFNIIWISYNKRIWENYCFLKFS